MSKKLVHFNWGACGDWMQVRYILKPLLKTTLFGNFCDVACDINRVRHQLEERGYKVTIEERNGHQILLLSDKEVKPNKSQNI